MTTETKEACPMCADTGFEDEAIGCFCTLCGRGLRVAMQQFRDGTLPNDPREQADEKGAWE